ncbi:hypothetical protein HDU98_011320 [Podochytrium sp. JEL0797]|nr:hypothetical protein HDU98_011320 [Podochytrium sp. JEL0797]
MANSQPQDPTPIDTYEIDTSFETVLQASTAKSPPEPHLVRRGSAPSKRTTHQSVATLTQTSRRGSETVSTTPAPAAKDKSSDSVASSESRRNSKSSVRLSSLGIQNDATDIFSVSQPVLHRTGWDIHGKVEDEEDSPTRKLAGLKLKYRYPIPNDLLRVNQYSGVLIVRPSSFAAAEMKWKRRWIVIKDNKAYMLKEKTDKTATAIIKLDDCIINPAEFGLWTNSFCLSPPPGAVNETNNGKEFMWVLIASSAEFKVEWIAAFVKAAGWKENDLAESGQVPKITVLRPESKPDSLADCFAAAKISPAMSNAPSSCASPMLRNTKSTPSLTHHQQSQPLIDTIFPFPTPDLSTLTISNGSGNDNASEKLELESNEALKLICASNARFFPNAGYKSAGNKKSPRPRRKSNDSGNFATVRAKAAGLSESETEQFTPRAGKSHADFPSDTSKKAMPRRQTSPRLMQQGDSGTTPPTPIRRTANSMGSIS